MKDRIPLYPGRVKMTPVSGQEDIYDMTRADQPTQEGSALNKDFFLPDDLALSMGLTGDPKVSDALRTLNSAAVRKNLLANWYFAANSVIDQRQGYLVPPGVSYYVPGDPSVPVGVTDKYYKVNSYGTTTDWMYFTIDGETRAMLTEQAVRGYIGTGYTIDRWKLSDSYGNAVVLINDDGSITLKNLGSSGVFWFTQYLEDTFDVGTVTSSVLATEIIGSSMLYNSPNADGITMKTGVTSVTNNKAESNLIRLVVSASSSVTIEAFKSELGRTQTLAHLENGEWVSNEMPDYREELLKCCMSTADPADTYANNNLTPLAIGATKTEIITYTGTGLSGEANPTTVTFSFPPKYVKYIGYSQGGGAPKPMPVTSGSNLYTRESKVDTWPTDYTEYFGFGLVSTPSTAFSPVASGKRSADGKTFSWYYPGTSSGAESNQYNLAGVTYQVLALG